MYERKKIELAIATIARIFFDSKGKYIKQTYLYKCLAFIDYESVKEWGHSVFDLRYKALTYGPVPIEIYEEGKYRDSPYYSWEKDLEHFDSDAQSYNIVPFDNRYISDVKEKYSEERNSYLSTWEKEKINSITQKYIRICEHAKDVSEQSHAEIIPWEKAYRNQRGSIMPWYLFFVNSLDDIDELDEKNKYLCNKLLTYDA